MGSNSVPPQVRWAIAHWPDDAERGAVGLFCREQGISRSVFYKIRAQARERGPMGAVEPGPRRPRASPAVADRAMIETALQVRAWLQERGLDHGPLSVGAKMRRQGLVPPSRATLARYFAAAGVAGPEPRKKPRSALRRFVYPAPNCCWQIDATGWSLADGRECVIFQLVDDHSRFALASLAARGETSGAAVAVMRTAISRWGVPQKLLSDNGSALNPTRRGRTGRLVELCQSLGIEPITGKPYKPTTQGKNERLHRTLLQWLNKQPPARTLDILQAQLDQFDAYYNHEREHQALPKGTTPAEAWTATAPAPEPTPPARDPLPAPPREPAGQTARTVQTNGRVTLHGCELHVDAHRVGDTVHVLWRIDDIEIFDADGLSICRYPRPQAPTRYLGTRSRLSTPK